MCDTRQWVICIDSKTAPVSLNYGAPTLPLSTRLFREPYTIEISDIASYSNSPRTPWQAGQRAHADHLALLGHNYDELYLILMSPTHTGFVVPSIGQELSCTLRFDDLDKKPILHSVGPNLQFPRASFSRAFDTLLHRLRFPGRG